MGLVHNEQAAFDNCPLLVDLSIGSGKALLSDCLGLTDDTIGLLLDIGQYLLGLLGALFHVFDIGLDSSLSGLKKIVYLCRSLSKRACLLDLDLVIVNGSLKLADLGLKSFYLLLLVMHDHHHFIFGKIQ